MKENFELAPLKIDIDFHNHTKGSDGRQSSLRFLLRASQQGKNIISMTDHDSVSGYKNFKRNRSNNIIQCVIVEILGYNFQLDKMEQEIQDRQS